MPQMNVMTIHSTFQSPLRSGRLTMSIKDERDRMQKDREQDLDDELDHVRASRLTVACSGLGM